MKQGDFEDIFDDLLPSDVKATELNVEEMIIPLDKKTSDSLREIGIRNIFIIEFDAQLGPQLKYFTDSDDLLEKMLINPAFVAEITIFAKYAEEVLLKDKRKLVIKEIVLDNQQFYIFVEIQKNFFSSRPLLFARYVHEVLKKLGKINKEVAKKAIRESILLATKSTFGLTI